jgi:hypothetical protein
MFFYDIFIVFDLTLYFFSFLLSNKFYVIVDFYYKLILINKFIKHIKINDSCCTLKYLDLYLSLNFLNFIFIYHQFLFYWVIPTSWFKTHDTHVIWTYLMLRSLILSVNSVYPGQKNSFFLIVVLIFLSYYQVN